MKTTRSKDGTLIAYDRVGQGPPVILVMGAFNDRQTGAPLAASLAGRFSVLTYDRRGRGDSGDSGEAQRYAIEREIEDLQAVLGAADGTASVFGYSSGAALVLAAAAHGAAMTRLALYELPPARPRHHPAELASLIGAGRRGDAVEYFQRCLVGIPEDVVAELRNAPFRAALERVAHTLVYDATLVSEELLTPELLTKVLTPTLAIAGGASPPFMRDVAATLARSLPNARTATLEGATHHIEPGALAPVLEEFFAAGSSLGARS
jgi:pimeloyl-ACP methyl ester carboxylesterase